MVEPAPDPGRGSIIPLFLVALLSALVVAGVYEVRARLAHHRLASRPLAPEQTEATVSAVGSSDVVEESCADLRRRYLSRCPSNLPLPAPARQVPPLDPGRGEDDARTADQLAAWLHPSSGELADMAKRCEVRFEMPAVTENQPPTVTDEASVALSLTGRERVFLQQTLREMHTGIRDFVARAAAERGPGGGTLAQPSLEEILAELQARPENGFENARERVAQERAGLVAPPEPGAPQPMGERLVRLWGRLGDDFERRLAEGLGSDRARQLRSSPQASWMNRFSQSGCRSQPVSSPPGPTFEPGR